MATDTLRGVKRRINLLGEERILDVASRLRHEVPTRPGRRDRNREQK
jgi:hypothetical protein